MTGDPDEQDVRNGLGRDDLLPGDRGWLPRTVDGTPHGALTVRDLPFGVWRDQKHQTLYDQRPFVVVSAASRGEPVSVLPGRSAKKTGRRWLELPTIPGWRHPRGWFDLNQYAAVAPADAFFGHRPEKLLPTDVGVVCLLQNRLAQSTHDANRGKARAIRIGFMKGQL